jgi:hypothetical protein
MKEVLMTFKEEIEKNIKGPHEFYPKDMGEVQAVSGFPVWPVILIIDYLPKS